MKKFKLYGFYYDNPIIITDSSSINSVSTFEESFSIKEHMKCSFSFKIVKLFADGQANPLIGLVYPKAKLRLELDDETYDLVIDDISNEFYELNTILSVSCEDYASKVFAKEGQGLSLSETGTLKELAYEVFVQSRKNLGYRGMLENFLSFMSYKEIDANSTVSGYAFNSEMLSGIDSYIIFPRSKNMSTRNYDLSFNLLSNPINGVRVQVVELDNNGTFITTHEILDEFAAPVIYTASPIVINFTPRKGMASYKVVFKSTSDGSMSVVDWKVRLNIAQFASVINTDWKLSDDFNAEHFKGKLGDISYYKKVTLELSNSNLYNALVELAKLFEAEIKFDYINETINFINKELFYRYNGVKLSPTFNLLSLSRTENSNETLTAIDIVGSDTVYSVFPSVPAEFKQFFYEEINSGFANFNDYSTTSYQDVIPFVVGYIASTENYNERLKLITDFAIAVDKIPNFENRIYNLDYFEKTNKIKESELIAFKDIIYNQLRKNNIKIRTYSDLYLNAHSLLLAKQSEIDFVSKNIVVEKLAQKDVLAEIAEEEENSAAWIGYKNQYDASVEASDQYRMELMQAYNIVFDLTTLTPLYLENEPINGSFQLTSNSYASLMLNVYGYYNIYLNGIRQELERVTTLLKEADNKLTTYKDRITYLTTQIEDPSITSFRRREFEVEKSGLESQIFAYKFLVGEYTTDIFTPQIEGQYQIQKFYLETIYRFLGNYVYKSTLIDYSTWVSALDLNSTYLWSSMGTVSVVTAPNKDYLANGQEDIMVRIQNFAEPGDSYAVATTKTQLDPLKNYRASGLFMVPANQSGVFSISVDSDGTPSMSMTINSVATDRWFGYEFYFNSAAPSKIYSFPEYAEVSNTFITTTTSPILTSDIYHVTYKFVSSAAEFVYLYRPRLDEVKPNLMDIEDIYNLYDNPLMINYEEDFHINFESIEGLYDLLYNENYVNNVIISKNEIINELYSRFPNYIIEGYYSNTDEMTSDGLLEQALLASETIVYPKISYGLSVIDMSAIVDYQFLKIRVGDKVLISENEDSLYLSYQPESTKYLQISEISYDLRNIGATSLTVYQDDETTKILQYILKATQ